MTYNDLCEEVKELGFETSIDSPERLERAARRALKTIFTEHPLYETVTLFQKAPSPIESIGEIRHRGGEDYAIPFSSARAFSFKSVGAGSAVISDEGGERTVSFAGNYSVTRCFLYGDGEIRFVGEYSYSVIDLGIFDEIFSDRTEDVPVLNSPREYNLSDVTRGFISFAAAPTDSVGNPISGATLRGSVLSLPASYSGNIHLTCKCSRELTEAGEIDLPAGCEPLLSLLTAAYYWLDDDADKAAYYHSLYREGSSSLRYMARSRLDQNYRIGNGWA